MGKRNVAKITVDGTDYTLMQFSDFSYIPNRYDATRYQMELANGIYYPTGVSVQGNTMNDIIPQGIGSSADNVSKPIDNYNAILLKQVPANQGNANFFSFYNSSNELLFEEGYLMTNYEANTLVNFAIVIDDDGFADVIGVLHYYNGSVTATRIDHFGGNGEIGQKIYAVFAQEASQSYTSNGGGATHIAKVTGQLKDLSSNLSDILMVSGGGGGGYLVGENAYDGADAGGISGNSNNSGNQSTGYAFGQGESATNKSGGGGGLYGGYKGTSAKSGGAGSGYIGNSLVSNKKMVGYNVPTSSDASTKTESVSVYSASGEANKPKVGNGKAKIKFLYIPSAPEEYASYINTLTGWKDRQNIDGSTLRWYPDNSNPHSGYATTKFTFYAPENFNGFFNVNTVCYSLALTTFYINKVSNKYVVTYDWQPINAWKQERDGVWSTNKCVKYRYSYLTTSAYGWSFATFEDVSPTDPNIPQYDTLAECLTYLQTHFLHCNIYVDGRCWGYAQ